MCESSCPEMTLIKHGGSCFLIVKHPKIYLYLVRQKPPLVSFLYTNHSATLALYIPATLSVSVRVCVSAFRQHHLYSKSSRQAGFWQGPELWNGLFLQFCRWLDQPIPLYLAEGSPNPTAAVPFCEILFQFTTLTDKKACTHACANPRPHATFI